MNQKTKTNIAVVAIGLLIVERFCMAHEMVQLKKDKRSLIKTNKFLVGYGLSLVDRIPPEQIEDAKNDLEFFSIVTQ